MGPRRAVDYERARRYRFAVTQAIPRKATDKSALGGVRRDDSRQAITERILQAAARVFAHAGFDGATMTSIALEANLPKPNVNYYFRDKLVLYRRVLHDVQTIWLKPLDLFHPDADPAETLEAYIRAKLDLSRRFPVESRVFANEMLQGAPLIGNYLRGDYNRRIAGVWETFRSWASQGLVDPVDPKHLMIQLWAATQTYADHGPQVEALLGTKGIAAAEFEAAAAQLAAMTIKGIGARRSKPRR